MFFFRVKKKRKEYRLFQVSNYNGINVSRKELALIQKQVPCCTLPSCNSPSRCVGVSKRSPVSVLHPTHGCHKGQSRQCDFVCSNGHSWLSVVTFWYNCRMCDIEVLANHVTKDIQMKMHENHAKQKVEAEKIICDLQCRVSRLEGLCLQLITAFQQQQQQHLFCFAMDPSNSVSSISRDNMEH